MGEGPSPELGKTHMVQAVNLAAAIELQQVQML
jgi:hypothetical protein